MHPFPHHYTVQSSVSPGGSVRLSAEGMPDLESLPPKAFGGPGDHWSPEDLFVAAIADCFVLSFRAVAAASKVEWTNLECQARGTLDRADGMMKFTAIEIHAKLTIAADTDEARAMRSLEKAEKTCLVTNSLNVEPHLEAEIDRA